MCATERPVGCEPASRDAPYNAPMTPAPARRARRLSCAAACIAALGLSACGDDAVAGPPSAPTIALALPLAELPQPPWLDAEGAKGFFPMLQKKDSRMLYDPLALVVLRPDKSYTFPWAEHPAGKIVFNTNNRGFREDQPTQVEKSGRRILVLGDSQTEGVVDNRDSFANVLESLLAQRGTPADVINGGIGATGPHNYLGVLLKHLDLRPDLVIVTLYDGNDFAHVLQLDDVLHQRKPHPIPREAMVAAKEHWPDQIPQAFSQAAVFHADPPAADRAVAAALVVCEEIARQAAAIQARVVFAALPTKPDLDHDDDALQAEMLAALGLTREDLGVNVRLGAQLLAALAAHGHETLDLLPPLSAAQGPLYWRKDYHLNIAGHAAVAAALLDVAAGGP